MAISESSPLLPVVEPLRDPKHHDPSPAETAEESPPLDLLRDIIIGFSDGLTVPFALTAGLSSLNSSRLVIIGGLAELFSGMISMGLGAYLAAATERDRYRSEHLRQLSLTRRSSRSSLARDLLAALQRRYAIPSADGSPLLRDLLARGITGLDADAWARLRMDLVLRLDAPAEHSPWVSGVAMALSYFVGGLVPMIPYFVLPRVRDALALSVALTLVVLLLFGYAKNYVAIRNHRAGLAGALQTLVVGVLAAGTSYCIVKLLDST